jgi:hypothetical protein
MKMEMGKGWLAHGTPVIDSKIISPGTETRRKPQTKFTGMNRMNRIRHLKNGNNTRKHVLILFILYIPV